MIGLRDVSETSECLCACGQWPRFGHASMVRLHTTISAPDVFSICTQTHTHTHTHTHTAEQWALRSDTFAYDCLLWQSPAVPLHAKKTSQQPFYNSASWHVLFNGLWVGHETTWCNQCRLGGFYCSCLQKIQSELWTSTGWFADVGSMACFSYFYGKT